MPPDPANGRAVIAPPPAGNRRAQKHGGYVASFTPGEVAEIAEIEDKLRSLAPQSSTL